MPLYNKQKRYAGILAHISSLPNEYGIGDLGPSAYEFANFLIKTKQTIWQILPLTPSSPDFFNSPYSSFSAFAGDILYISPEFMLRDKWINKEDLFIAKLTLTDKVNFEKTIESKNKLFDLAFEKHKKTLLKNEIFTSFLNQNSHWLNDYAFFMAARHYFNGKLWTSWPNDLKFRKNSALEEYGILLKDEILKIKFLQYLFFTQIRDLKNYLNKNNIYFIGDVSIYINHNSSDVWANQHLFYLNENQDPSIVAGVPPDYFSKTGQRWGNPLFNWKEHKKENYAWWKSRLQHNLNTYNYIRIDHFLAFNSYWAIPSTEKIALNGYWKLGPGEDFFNSLNDSQVPLNFIAEDLGVITKDVTKLRKKFKLPGMRILQFAFDDLNSNSAHIPYNIPEDNFVYTGTHDNNTTLGWYNCNTTKDVKKQIQDYINHPVNKKNISWEMIRLAWLSNASAAITTIQDILTLDESTRFNTPGTTKNNWLWRLTSFTDLLNVETIEKLKKLTILSNRI